jgi:type III secretion system YscQ/HrcQ family protein
MIFSGLAEWTPASVAAQNSIAGLFPAAPEWEKAVRSALSSILRYPAGYRVSLTATHRLEPGRAPITATLDTTEVTIGRDKSSGLVLPEAAIKRQHARLLINQGLIYLEDLGSPLGTFIGERKLTANTPEPIAPGTEFTIFPHAIQARVEQMWASDPRFRLDQARTSWRAWRDVPRDQMLGCAAQLEPGVGHIWLGVRASLIREVLRGVYGSEPIDMVGLLESDAGCLDFILNSCLDQFNSELRWPLRLAWKKWAAPPPFEAREPGLLVETAAKLRDTSGAVVLFIPERCLRAIPRRATDLSLPEAFGEIPLPCVWQLSGVELAASEVATLEEGDTVLFDPEPKLILAAGHAGWECGARDDNFSLFRLDKPLVRMDGLSIDASPLSDVPVLLQVILARKSFSLGELRQLAPGSIVDLERAEDAPVELAVNGKVMGRGELVRIEGQLGVKVIGWNA